ncbi:MAG: CxxC-x17-CxxC domain-containing protein [Patescibacteria group bacterium]|nr:CxxC-x17-CxxC domain-containing protein [Patescibacteria group bacterium]
MFKPRRGNSSGDWKGGQGRSSGGFKGGNRYGESKPWERGGDRGFSDSPKFKAICAECDSPCEVPFKPNGSRPVLCSWCFKKSGGGNDEPRESRGMDRRGDRGEMDSRRPAFGGGESSDGKINKQFIEQMVQMNAKLDAILKALTSNVAKQEITADEHALDIVAAPVKEEKTKEKTKAKKAAKKKA